MVRGTATGLRRVEATTSPAMVGWSPSPLPVQTVAPAATGTATIRIMAEEAAALLRTGLRAIPAERLRVNPDCGLKTRGWPETRASLEDLVAAAHTVRGELPAS